MTQCQQVLQHLDSGKPLTQRDALRLYGVSRLAARIYDLQQRGVRITARSLHVRTRNGWARVAEYVRG
jgi:uncharacterized small protein (DUF1192 family)